MKNPYQNAVPFAYVLLETYKKIGLSDEEAIVVLMIDHLLEQGNHFINADMLSLKMGKSPSDINKLMDSMLKRGFLTFAMKEKMETSIAPLREKCYAIFADTLERQRLSLVGENEANLLSGLLSFFEERLSRTLSPLEKDTISEWLNSSYSVDEIKNALLDTLKSGKKTIRAVEKTLKARRKENDILKEGASAINDNWDKDIEATIALTKSMWGE